MQQPLTSNQDLAGPPVNIIQLKRNNFPSAETETGEQEKNRVVAAARRGLTVAATQHPIDFLRNEVLGDCGQAPIGDTGNSRGQLACSSPF